MKDYIILYNYIMPRKKEVWHNDITEVDTREELEAELEALLDDTNCTIRGCFKRLKVSLKDWIKLFNFQF